MIDLEKEHSKSDIVLVRGVADKDVRMAFKNYFSDARDFISLIESACNKLSPGVANVITRKEAK